MDELAPALCANLCCLGMYCAIAGGTWGLAHRRMKRIEAEDGPPELLEENRWFVYAGALFVWVVPAVLTVFFLFRRDRSRMARDCLALLWAHLGFATLISGTVSVAQALHLPPALPVMVGIAIMMIASALAMTALVWRGGAARVRRIEALPATGPAMGSERFAYYAGAAFVGMVGPIAAWLLKEPQNVAVGVQALRISAIQLTVVIGLTVTGLCVFVAVMAS